MMPEGVPSSPYSRQQQSDTSRPKVIHMDRGCPTGWAMMAGKNLEKGFMSKKEQFLAFVWVGALAQDFSRKTHDTPLIMHIASRIPEDHIPDNVMNAAKVFLAYCNGVCKRPYPWMLKTKAEG
jgi:hypothetical protein